MRLITLLTSCFVSTAAIAGNNVDTDNFYSRNSLSMKSGWDIHQMMERKTNNFAFCFSRKNFYTDIKEASAIQVSFYVGTSYDSFDMSISLAKREFRNEKDRAFISIDDGKIYSVNAERTKSKYSIFINLGGLSKDNVTSLIREISSGKNFKILLSNDESIINFTLHGSQKMLGELGSCLKEGIKLPENSNPAPIEIPPTDKNSKYLY